MAVFRPDTGLWAIRELTRVYFGAASDQPLPADYTGEAQDGIGIFRPATGLWAVRDGSRIYFGQSSDTPVSR